MSHDTAGFSNASCYFTNLQRCDRVASGSQSSAGRVRAHIQAFGEDEAEVGHAQETEERLQIRRLRIVRRTAVLAAACGYNNHLLARYQAFRAVRTVLERDARTCDPAEVRLELRRNAEVAHRCSDHDHSSRLHFSRNRFA